MFFHSRAGAALVVMLAFFAASAGAETQPLTLAQAQRLALERSRQLAAQNHAVSAARDMAVAAGQLPDPVLKAGIDNLPVSGPERLRVGADFMTMRRIGVMQEFTSSDKRRWRAERFEREAERARANGDVLAASISRDTAIAWLDRYYLEQMGAEQARQVAQARDEIAAAEAAFRGGRGTQAGLLEARAALLALEERAAELAQQTRSAALMLARWTDAPPEVALAGAPDTASVAVDPATLESSLLHHPKVMALTRQADLAQADAELARANRRADWSVDLSFQQRGPGNSNMLSFGVSVPLQWDRARRQDRELAARLAEVEQAQAERDEALREHAADVRAQMAEWESGRARIARYAQQVLPLAGQRAAAVLAAYRGGKASLAEVLAARRAQGEQRLQMLQLERENARVWAQLTFIQPATKGHP